MALDDEFISERYRSDTDEVRIVFDARESLIVERYQVQMAMLTQPATFQIQIGHSDAAAKLLREVPPRTPFELFIAGTRQFAGFTDGAAVPQAAGTSVVLSGRDTLAPLVDAFVTSAKTFTEISVVDLVKWSLDQVYGAGNYRLIASNAANAAAKSNAGKKNKTLKNAAKLTAQTSAQQGPVVPEAAQGAGIDDLFIPRATAAKKVQAKVGMRHYDGLLKPQLDRAGIFLWATASGNNFVLSELRPKQASSYGLKFQRGSRGNIQISRDFANDTSRRYSKATVYGRKGGGKESRTELKGEFVDDEMVAWGFDRPFVVEDEKCQTSEQCEFVARKIIGETRRSGWRLGYTVSGHTTKLYDGGVGIWTTDTVMDVDDEEIGIREPLYIESVEHVGEPHMETRIRLMRPADCIFGTGSAAE